MSPADATVCMGCAMGKKGVLPEPDPSTPKPDKNILFRESIAIWFYGIGAIAYSVATNTGLPKLPPVNWHNVRRLR